MADISQIKIGTTTYDIKDSVARTGVDGLGTRMTAAEGEITSIKSEIKGGTHLLGKVMSSISEEIIDGSHYSGPIYIEGTQIGVTAKAGDIVLNGAREFIWDGVAGTEEGTSYLGTWHDLGNEQGLGALAYKDNASGSISTNAHSHNYDKTSVTHSVTNPAMTSTGNFTPAGSISVGGSSGTSYTPAGSIGTGATSGAEVVTGGSNASSAVTLSGGRIQNMDVISTTSVGGTVTTHDTPTLNKSSIGSASGWSAGSLPSYTYDSSSETLTLTAGSLPSLTVTSTQVGTSLTAGTALTVATKGSDIIVATGTLSDNGTGDPVATELPSGGTAAAQSFTPTKTKLGFTGTATKLAFSGTQGSVSVTGTPAVSVADHTQTSTATNSVTVTGTATVS